MNYTAWDYTYKVKNIGLGPQGPFMGLEKAEKSQNLPQNGQEQGISCYNQTCSD
jgi:hypothetical protein